jgi:hypothetical protein
MRLRRSSQEDSVLAGGAFFLAILGVMAGLIAVFGDRGETIFFVAWLIVMGWCGWKVRTK